MAIKESTKGLEKCSPVDSGESYVFQRTLPPLRPWTLRPEHTLYPTAETGLAEVLRLRQRRAELTKAHQQQQILFAPREKHAACTRCDADEWRYEFQCAKTGLKTVHHTQVPLCVIPEGRFCQQCFEAYFTDMASTGKPSHGCGDRAAATDYSYHGGGVDYQRSDNHD